MHVFQRDHMSAGRECSTDAAPAATKGPTGAAAAAADAAFFGACSSRSISGNATSDATSSWRSLADAAAAGAPHECATPEGSVPCAALARRPSTCRPGGGLPRPIPAAACLHGPTHEPTAATAAVRASAPPTDAGGATAAVATVQPPAGTAATAAAAQCPAARGEHGAPCAANGARAAGSGAALCDAADAVGAGRAAAADSCRAGVAAGRHAAGAAARAGPAQCRGFAAAGWHAVHCSW